MRAVGEFGNSGYTAVLDAATGQLPPAPSALAIASFTAGAIELAWQDNAGGAAETLVERQIGAAAFAVVGTASAGDHGFVDSTAVDGVLNRYRVRTLSAFGFSGYSGVVEAYTQLAIVSVEPSTSPTTGGTAVVVTGTNFFPGTVVSLGGLPLEGATVESLTEVRGLAPAHPAGAVAVRAENSFGATDRDGLFTYVATRLRGDVNSDRSIDLSDPIFLLAALFQGGPQPDCDDVADVNFDLDVDISDAVRLLDHLFLGGGAITPEFADCP